MNKTKWKNLARLALVTFVQGILAVWAVTGFSIDHFDPKLLLGGGVAATASLAYNVARPLKKKEQAALIGAEYPDEEFEADLMGFMGDEGLPDGYGGTD